MTIQEWINKLSKEHAIPISRPKIFHYEAKGVFGEISREANNERNFSNKDYVKVKLALLLAELKFDTQEIKKVLSADFEVEELVQKLKIKRSIIAYLLSELS